MTEQRLYYTAVDGSTQQRRVKPQAFVWHKHADLPAHEWFILALDLDACSTTWLRLAGCDFTQGALDAPPAMPTGR